MDGLNSIYRQVVVTNIAEEAAGVKTFTVAFADGSAIPYVAGQFITFSFTHHGREERRSYSVSSCPALNEPLSFTVKRLDNGAYSRLFTDKVRVGDMLTTTGVAGRFILPAPGAGVYFFFAAGIGITPVYSLIRQALHATSARVVLVYSNSNADDVVFGAALRSLEVEFPGRLRIEWLFSNAFNLSRARLNKALLPMLVTEYVGNDMAQSLFYICGPFAYMRMATWALQEMGIARNAIIVENFSQGLLGEPLRLPPDKEDRLVTLRSAQGDVTFTCHYPDSLLTAARNNNIPLPYSCEAGRCGSCVMLCTSGKVWHALDEVLTAGDIANGLVLTCTGHPVGGNVVLQL